MAIGRNGKEVVVHGEEAVVDGKLGEEVKTGRKAWME